MIVGAGWDLGRVAGWILGWIDPFGWFARSMGREDPELRHVDPSVRALGADGAALPDLAAFVADHYDRLIRLAGLVCRSVPDAEDAVQSAIERAWRNRRSLRDPERIKPWLDRIVVREAIRITRSRESLVGRLLRRAEDDVEIDLVDPRATDAARMTEVRDAFARLSAEQRAVVALHLYAGYSVAETAAIVDAPLETTRSRLRLARHRLRLDLDPS